MFLHIEAIFLYYSVSIPNISDFYFCKKVHSCIDTSIFTVVLGTWIFINSCKTLSDILTHVINKQRLNKLLFDD